MNKIQQERQKQQELEKRRARNKIYGRLFQRKHLRHETLEVDDQLRLAKRQRYSQKPKPVEQPKFKIYNPEQEVQRKRNDTGRN